MRNAGPASLTLLPAEGYPAWGGLRDFAFMLGEDAAGLAGRLAPGTAAAVGDLVRGMNCYYSNLIEGHDTRPVDIERALHADFATEPKQRDLQLEAAAHIAVQAAIDTGAIDATQAPSALAVEIYRQFYNRLPDSLRWVEELGSGRRAEVIPGQWRGGNVKVGANVAPPAEELPGWMARFDECTPERFGRSERLVAIAAAHHRLLWIHPFADGNGRVARLLSHALLRRAGVGSPLWSVSRGLARNVDAYRAYLARATTRRRVPWTDAVSCRTGGWRISAGSSSPPVSIRSASCGYCSHRKPWQVAFANSSPPRRPATGSMPGTVAPRTGCAVWRGPAG